jgi:hypothetical protein
MHVVTARRVLSVLALAAALVALIHVPPHPARFIVESCCPPRSTSEVMRTEWLLAVSMTFITVVLCGMLAVTARRGALRLSIALGAAAALASAVFASDLVIHLRLAAADVSLNLALISVVAFIASVVAYFRNRSSV